MQMLQTFSTKKVMAQHRIFFSSFSSVFECWPWSNIVQCWPRFNIIMTTLLQFMLVLLWYSSIVQYKSLAIQHGANYRAHNRILKKILAEFPTSIILYVRNIWEQSTFFWFHLCNYLRYSRLKVLDVNRKRLLFVP